MNGARPLLFAALAVVLAEMLWNGDVFAQEKTPALQRKPVEAQPPSEKPSASDKQLLEKLLKRLDKVESELSRLRAGGGQPPVDHRDQKLVGVLEASYLGSAPFASRNNSRFFAARLILVNQTSEPVTVRREDISMQVDAANLSLSDIPDRLQYHSFRAGNQNFQLRDMKPAARTKVPAGGTASTWIVFANIPNGTQIPQLRLKINAEGKTLEINVNDFALGLLGLSVERIGPRQSLALLTISGEVNTINVGSLIDTLSSLTTQKVGRAVIRWTPEAPVVEGLIAHWLRQAAREADGGETRENALPALPAAIRELHLAQIPNEKSTGRATAEGVPQHVHKTDLEAVRAALESAYEILPLDELLVEIEKGHPLTRAAALACGGGRLAGDKLPILLKYADDVDPHIQLAALSALQHFGEKEAVEKLVEYARKNSPPTGAAAVESLAASRFAAAHQALLEILKNEPPQSKKLIVAVLARHPRPIWSESIYEFVSHPDAELSTEALRALASVGHSKLLEVLLQALERGNPKLREEAFDLLINRSDRESEELAMNYTLKHLEKLPPSDKMTSLLNRTKDPRAIPLLLAHLKQAAGNRPQIITLLGQIGDQSVAEVLVAMYPGISGRDKGAVLNALQQLKSPSFRKLAGEALLSSDSSASGSAVSGLQNDGSAEAIRMLIEALDKSTDKTPAKLVSEVTSALGTLGTKEAQAALRRARDNGSDEKRTAALRALERLRQSSPGFGYVYQAQQAEEAKKWDEAIARYSTAMELDPELPDAYSGRGHSLLMLNKNKEAQADFRKAVELDPFNSVAITGLAITFVLDGKIDEGLKSVEDVRPKFQRDQLYFYNTACVYGRALEVLKKGDNKTPDRQKKIEEYSKKAIDDLRNAQKLGFNQTDWMKKDPDLNSLHDVPDFQKLVNADPEAKKKEKDDENGENGEKAPFDSSDSEEQGSEDSEELNTEVELTPEQVQADIDFLEATP